MGLKSEVVPERMAQSKRLEGVVGMNLVFVCSPYKDDIEANIARAKRYCYFAFIKGTVPYAPHLHNPQFLDEDTPEERSAGIELGLEVMKRADEIWCFGNKLTEGMEAEIRMAHQLQIPIRYFTEKCEEVKTDEGVA